MEVPIILFWLIASVAAGFYAQRLGRSYTAWPEPEQQQKGKNR